MSARRVPAKHPIRSHPGGKAKPPQTFLPYQEPSSRPMFGYDHPGVE